MKKITLDGKVVELYDNIEDLPILRFHKYNKMLLVDAGIGSDLADFDRHIERAILYAKSGKGALAATEMENIRQNVYLIQSNVSPRNMAFAVLVKSIDGKPCNDLSDEGLKRVVAEFENVANTELTGRLDSVKKKIDEELRAYFPKMFDDVSLKEYYDKLRRRTLLILDSVATGNTSNATQIKNITDELVTYFNPQSFSGQDNAEVQYDRQFEDTCLLISQNLHTSAKGYTVLEYYNALEYLKEEAKKARKRANAK